MKSGGGFFETYHPGPPLVDINALRDLGELLGKPGHDAATVDATHFQGNYLASTACRVLKELVRVFLTLHPADDPPRSVSMGYDQRYRLRAILRDPVVVMLINFAQVSRWPRKQTATHHSLDLQGDPHA